MQRLLLTGTLVIGIAACNAGSTPAGQRSGVRGRVLSGPGCPVETQPVHPQTTRPGKDPCEPRPARAEVRAVAVDSGAVVATVQSDTHGRFEVDLEAGQYELQAHDPDDGSAAGPPLLVTIRRQAVTEVVVTLDTGIR